MKRPQKFLAASVALGLGLTLAACGSDDNGDSGGSGSGKAKIGVILPDTESSVRWETADRPALEAAFKKAGIDYDIQNTEGDPDKMTQLADSMIGDGATVLAIVNIDSASGAAIEKKAASQGVATLDYDRLTLGGSAKAYISYDNVKVGALQGQGLADCMGDKGGNIVYINGSPDDNNATLFAQGAHSVLDKMSNFKKVGEQAIPDWDADTAAKTFQQLYTAANGKVDGVLAANDGLGGAVIGVLEGAGQAGKVPVTGQDATVEGLQNILAGTQCMTVFKSSVGEANALADAAIALANGDDPKTTGTVKDTESGKDVPSVILDPIAINKQNIGTEISKVFADGAISYDDVCTAKFKAACDKAGIKP